ncbi:MAG: tRNA guanosine(34) transglycosylase Tgt [Gemmatimonadaceae bacterium]
MSFTFDIEATAGAARAGVFVTPHGPVRTPAFMPVGTLATVKALDPAELRAAGAQMLLANAYHVHLRPGDDLVRELGGLHDFMGWDGPILTDSGGFQVFSLEGLRRVSEEGVEFRSHIDGSPRFFTPESVMRIERNLAADVIMQFDHVIPGQSTAGAARDASDRSVRWLERCLAELRRIEAEDTALPGQMLFPIVQGGVHAAVRRDAARAITDILDWPGIAVGGLSLGEPKPEMYAVLELVDAVLPRAVPRYLMGVGFPEDLIEGVRRGMDLFDCVAPTRMGRNGTAFTSAGRLNVRRAGLRADPRPIDELCLCSTCLRFSRAYIRHLFMADEMLGMRLLSLHNVHFLVALMTDARASIREGTLDSWSHDWLARYHSHSVPVP